MGLLGRRGGLAPKSRFPILGPPGRGAAHWEHLNSTATTDPVIAQEAARRKYILLNAWEADYVTKIKAANPSCMCLVYKDISSVRTDENGPDLPCGLGWTEANDLATGGSDYFLKDSGGNRIEYSGYEDHWQMNVAAAGYRQLWADNVIANAQLRGFDGVFGDNALFQADQYGTVGTAYTTDSATQAAYVGFLQAVYPRMQQAGLKLFANLTNARVNGSVWSTYMQYLDGGEDEFFLTFDSGDANFVEEYSEGWSKQVAQIVSAEAAGKVALVMPHYDVGDTNAFRYAYAGFLMGYGGRSSFAEVNVDDGYGAPTPYHTEFDWDLGAPTGAYFTVQSNVFRRNFSAGAVVVNANATGTGNVNVSLGGTYLNEAGTSVTSVTLAPVRGTILRTP
jgi:hypothetical protein